MLMELAGRWRALVGLLGKADYLAPLALRLYLAPVFWVAGLNKVEGFGSVVEWFGNADWGLGLPVPALLAGLATAAEVGGGVMLLLGLGVRLIVLPLMVTMIVAAVSVHWDNGWQAVHDLQSPFASAHVLGIEADDASAAIERLGRARQILREHEDYEWLTQQGNFVISNSGIEWAATYFVMLLALLFAGGGRYFSIDYWLARRWRAA
ncbi:MAG: DoxX family protein [Steroidobacteraceae bacterium]